MIIVSDTSPITNLIRVERLIEEAGFRINTSLYNRILEMAEGNA